MEIVITGFLVLLVVVVLLLKRMSYVRADIAKRLIEQGAAIVDVRSAAEFSGRHLECAVNIPLDELEARISTVVPDKQAPVLVHCLSGTRSAMAARKLKQLGYKTVENLGSYGRASKLTG